MQEKEALRSLKSPRRRPKDGPYYRNSSIRGARRTLPPYLGRQSLRIALLSAALLYLGFWGLRARLRLPHADSCSARLAGTEESSKFNAERRRLYEDLDGQLSMLGLKIGQEQTQGLDARALFHLRDGQLEPALYPLKTPVRGIVLPLGDTDAARALAEAVEQHLRPLSAEAGLWATDARKLHATLFHASPHQHPVEASSAEVAAEVAAVRGSAASLCPLEVVLERVVATPTGNILACWQLAGGSEPAAVRRALQSALPRAPPAEKQTVREPALLHTTLARLVAPPAAQLLERGRGDREGRLLRSPVIFTGDNGAAAALQAAVRRASDTLCGLRTTLPNLWYVEEQDLLALALNGRYRAQTLPLLCQRPPPRTTNNLERVRSTAERHFPISQ